MKNAFLKLAAYIVIVAFFNNCSNTGRKTIQAIQGKWNNLDGTLKTIEIKGEEWIEDAPGFGVTVYHISLENDSVFALEVTKNTNTFTFYKKGMLRKLKLKSLKQNTMNLVEIGTDNINEFDLGFYKKN